jgi:hypothetical protein
MELLTSYKEKLKGRRGLQFNDFPEVKFNFFIAKSVCPKPNISPNLNHIRLSQCLTFSFVSSHVLNFFSFFFQKIKEFRGIFKLPNENAVA